MGSFMRTTGNISKGSEASQHLLKDNIPKISDWGLSKVAGKLGSLSESTVEYAAPEQILGGRTVKGMATVPPPPPPPEAESVKSLTKTAGLVTLIFGIIYMVIGTALIVTIFLAVLDEWINWSFAHDPLESC